MPRNPKNRPATAHRDVGPRVPPIYTIVAAATRLATSPAALRARCRRAAIRHDEYVLADLGGGVVAFKFGCHWRVQFEREGAR